MTTNRIQFIDQLRGLVMIMIVMNHLIQFTFGISGSFMSLVFEAIDLPVFFFISGYFMQKKESLSLKELPGQLLKRARAYLLPLASMGALYCVLTGYNFHHFITSGGGKLWFLYTLFWMAFICLIINYIITPPHQERGLDKQVIVDLIGFGLPFIALVALYFKFPDTPGILPWSHLMTYYPYFVLGIFMKKYDSLEKLVRTNVWIYTLAVIVFVGGINLLGQGNRLVNMVLILMTTTEAIIALWHFFSHIEKQNRCTRVLSIIGQHTLPIYVFHYFFIPDLAILTPYISGGNPFIVHTVVCLILCACIIPVCIVIERLIERSPMLNFLLLGKKYHCA